MSQVSLHHNFVLFFIVAAMFKFNFNSENDQQDENDKSTPVKIIGNADKCVEHDILENDVIENSEVKIIESTKIKYVILNSRVTRFFPNLSKIPAFKR